MQFYKQTTEYTCAPSALMMIINHFKENFKLTKENEYMIWKDSVVLPIRAASIYGLALFAYTQGLKFSVCAQNLEYDFPDYKFKGYTKQEVEQAKFMSKLYLKRLKKLNIQIEERDFNIRDIKRQLYNGKILLLRLDAGVFREKGRTSNYVVVSGIRNSRFVIYDPMQGRITLNEDQLRESLKDLSEKRRRDHKMIIFG